MTRLRVDGNMIPVTLLAVLPQEIIRYKSQDKDGYDAVVVGVDKKSKDKKSTYGTTLEFSFDDDFAAAYQAGTALTADLFKDVEAVTVTGTSKGKGYQGAMKRFGLKGGPKTHGSKFHRQIGSLGNRKPRRVQKGHPHAGQMGGDRTTLHTRPLIDVIEHEGQHYVIIKGSVPGGYNSTVQVII
jgi:large subunit ribosomal protein L3